jgi:hypothetical protein
MPDTKKSFKNIGKNSGCIVTLLIISGVLVFIAGVVALLDTFFTNI